MPDKRATMAARKLRKIFGSPAGLSASPAGISASPAGIFFSPVAYLLDSRLDFGRVPSRVLIYSWLSSEILLSWRPRHECVAIWASRTYIRSRGRCAVALLQLLSFRYKAAELLQKRYIFSTFRRWAKAEKLQNLKSSVASSCSCWALSF